MTVLMMPGVAATAQGQGENVQPPAHDHDPRDRFITNRDSRVQLPLTDEQDAFFFVVFGDRTGGPADGVQVLAQAVADTNLLKPDLVMTVGDMIQGYNNTAGWLAQMREYKGIMEELDCEWFPVAGNHDIYWRGPGKPEGEHEDNYEEHFGPLWYAFEHKDCWFVILHSDEGGADGRFEFGRPESQRMSEEQFGWLTQTLESAADAPHVFIFLHHPRWNGGGYGDDWQRVHALLAEAGNVSAVFAGHVHRMSHDGLRDGIEYVTLATTGGHQPGLVPGAGYLHHFDVVTVRGDDIGLAAIPVGGVMDVRAITQEVQRETVALSRSAPRFEAAPVVSSDGVESGEVAFVYSNPTSRPVDATVYLDTADSRWRIGPDHQHARIDAGGSHTFTFDTARIPAGLDAAYRGLEVVTQADYLGEGIRVPIPERRDSVPVRLRMPTMERPEHEQVLSLDGDDALLVPSASFDLPDGAMTVECWVKPTELGDRVGLVCKTESSEYGLMVEGGRLNFFLFLGSRYATASCRAELLGLDQWHHVAGVFDGEQMRLYLDGRQVGSQNASGARRTNALPLVIGGDVNNRGDAVSMFVGEIDAVRVSNTARYGGESFEPARRHDADEHTVLLQQMDGAFVGHYLDASASEAHATAVGDPELVGAAGE
ncbi:metallophosphoesterase [Phycisphaeraceae bacterium D3-23]